jgi:hypothetical protein
VNQAMMERKWNEWCESKTLVRDHYPMSGPFALCWKKAWVESLKAKQKIRPVLTTKEINGLFKLVDMSSRDWTVHLTRLIEEAHGIHDE